MSALTFAAKNLPESLSVEMTQDSVGDVMVVNGEDFPLNTEPVKVTINPKNDKEGKVQEKYKKERGKFYIEELDEGVDTLYLIPIAEIRRSRAYFEKYAKGESNVPLCRSLDGENPDPNIEGGGYADKCGTYSFGNTKRLVDFQNECEYSKWREGPLPPLCGEAVQVAFLNAENGSLLEFEFKRTSLGPYEAAITALVKKQKALRSTRKDSHDLIFKVKMVDNDKYFTPEFEVVRATGEGLEHPVKFLPVSKWYHETVIVPLREERTTPRNQEQEGGEMEVVSEAAGAAGSEDQEEEGAGFSMA